MRIQSVRAAYGDLRQRRRHATSRAKPLTGLFVLVLEADRDLGRQMHKALQRGGARVLGPFQRAQEALEAAEGGWPDCALADVALGQLADFAPARALLRLGVPIILVNGCDAQIPDDLRQQPRLEKPFTGDMLTAAVKGVCRA